MVAGFAARGWARFPTDPALARWAEAALPAARRALAEATEALRCGGTWDVGLEALPNDAEGAVAGVPLAGAAIDAVETLAGRLQLHRAQLSTVHPGYPRPWVEEGEAAFRYRLLRDAAHVDGLLPVGSERRRMIREPHAWILGLPLTRTAPGASPPVVWEGSHHIMSRAFSEALAGHPLSRWAEVDVTEAYHAARREVFAVCDRVVLHAEPGEAVLIHRLALHGISPWTEAAEAPPEGRIIAYFRPELPGGIADWLTV
ncbi:hypothetical protein OEZ60_02115 [Defluviimonas sp. WL0024]|uniref:Phytanoyl-CoA dioxygenase (PhyH) n=2 Tax=Albidovulum TaxID=205889 RepID=A0ABT3J031_9RHOB|nr:MULTISPECIES: hypothetical protein [Defluviimonas]MCU9846788.1 hypothetical protein [Defluviimonas sp. WL0024]MCW3781047.1 hypothetical protein [Defluviimonas salinarum]